MKRLVLVIIVGLLGFVVYSITQTPPEPKELENARFLERGTASHYAMRFNGQVTANGERFDNSAYTAAHLTLDFGTLVKVVNPKNGKEVLVRINDRGPYIGKRIIDLSKAAAEEIDLVRPGTGLVDLYIVEVPGPVETEL